MERAKKQHSLWATSIHGEASKDQVSSVLLQYHLLWRVSCKQSKTGGVEGLETRLSMQTDMLDTVDFTSLRTCVFRRFSRKLCSANMIQVPAASGLQCIPGHVISVKLHPQRVLVAKRSTEYTYSKRSEIDRILG